MKHRGRVTLSLDESPDDDVSLASIERGMRSPERGNPNRPDTPERIIVRDPERGMIHVSPSRPDLTFRARAQRVSPTRRNSLRQPLTYTTLSISSYSRDVEVMDKIIGQCKAAGISRASRSWLIREAIARLDVSALIADALTQSEDT